MAVILTREAHGAVLNWLVAKCVVPNDPRDGRPGFWLHPNNPKLVCRISHNYVDHPDGYTLCLYTTDWAQGGPIIEREAISLGTQRNEPGFRPRPDFLWHAQKDSRVYVGYGPTPLIAAMRCYVSSRFGDTVEVPDELA